MKKFAAGLWTVLCATAASIAQPIDQPAEIYPAEQTDIQQPAFEETQPAAQSAVQQNSDAASVYTANNVATSNIQAASESPAAVSNDPQAADEQPLPEYIPAPKKKTIINFGAGASFIYGNFFGFEGLKNDDMEDPTGFGGDFGIKASFLIIDGLQFSPQIMFRIFNLNHEDEGFTRYYNQTFLDFTFFMRGFITDKIYLEVGPQISINTTSDVKINEDGNFKEKIEQSPAEFGISIGAGYFVHKQVSIGFNWYMGFNEVFPDVRYYFDDDFIPSDRDKYNWSLINLKGAHTMMFKLGVTYWFLQ